MRIVAGMWRGRSFDAPEGRETRPTTDRMRESIASMVLSERGLELSGCRVLDAFAGSGGMGLELLSRGARHCTFCEKNRRTATLIRNNCKKLGAEPSRWRVVAADVHGLARRSSDSALPFDVVFLDPPYAMPAQEVGQLVQELDMAGLLSQDCLVVYERASDGAQLETKTFVTLRSKRHGGTCIDILNREADT